MIFQDRHDAGRQLAARLLPLKDERPLVLALPRGGVVVGFEVAIALDAPLDVVLVRKIGAPHQPELAVGAVVDGEQAEIVINREIVDLLRVSERYLARETARQLKEIERRRRAYLGSRGRMETRDRTAILVDDGIATGATIRAGLRAIRRAGPRRLVLAVPVAPQDVVETLQADADEIVCPHQPADLAAIGFYYADFHQVSDAEVVGLLERAPGGGRDPE